MIEIATANAEFCQERDKIDGVTLIDFIEDVVVKINSLLVVFV